MLNGDDTVWKPPLARPASTVALLRDVSPGIAVYLVQRAPTMNFPAVTAYPGGGHEPRDGDPEDPVTPARAAIREVREETAIDLAAPQALVPFARWVTPEVLPARFDTHFFAAALPQSQEPQLVGTEAVLGQWWSPGEVVDQYQALGLRLLPPTLATLNQLAKFETVESALAGIRPPQIPTLLPRPIRTPDGLGWEVVDLNTGAVFASGDTLSEL